MNKTHLKLLRQGPEAHAAMKRATKLTDGQIERFMKDPEDSGLRDEELDMLDGWARGEFGYMSTQNGYVRIKHMPQPPVIMIRPDKVKHGGQRYEAGTSGGPFTTSPAKNKGADLPSPDEAKMARVRAREEEQRKQSMFKNPFKKTEMQAMPRILHGS